MPHSIRPQSVSFFRALLAAGLIAVPFLAGCGSDGNNRHEFLVRSASGTVAGNTEVVVSGLWAAYFQSEQFSGMGNMGELLNTDGDMTDHVVRAIHLEDATDTSTGVAATEVALVSGHFYMSVNEADDGIDWSGVNGATERVLVHWTAATGVATYIDTLPAVAAGAGLVSTGSRLFYTAEVAMLAAGETNLRRIELADPMNPVVVGTQSGTGTLDVTMLGIEDGLAFLALNEDAAGPSLNGDADFSDDFVLGLLLTGLPDTTVVNVGLALKDANAPFDALTDVAGERLVAFVVDEASEGGTNLNAPALFPMLSRVPDACAAMPDNDAIDQVLHYLHFNDFSTGGLVANTGLVGRDRVLVVAGAVATLSDEFDANCDLNGDGMINDTVVRWVSTATPEELVRDSSQLFAVNTAIPGGAMGVATLLGRIVCVVDESQDMRNLDKKVNMHNLVAWVDPVQGDGAVWTFAHQDPNNIRFGTGIFEDVDGDGLGDPLGGASEPYAGTGWMAPNEERGRLPMTFLEEVPGTSPKVGSLNLNSNCAVRFKDNDETDSLPVWLDFQRAIILDFDGIGYAVDAANAGIVISGSLAYFRVSEIDDATDYNGDNVLDDVVLMRNSVSACDPTVMSSSSTIPGPVIITDGILGAAFLCDESMAGIDLNGDGDAIDLVVRFFTI